MGRVRQVGRVGRVGLALLCATLAAPAAAQAPTPAPAQTYKGLEVALAGVTRATNVSLTDCPPGENIVRGVIKPGDTTEFASITLDFKALPTFQPLPLPKPVLHDESGKSYNTAQAFAEIVPGAAFSCTFSFRVPRGTELATLALDTLSFEMK